MVGQGAGGPKVYPEGWWLLVGSPRPGWTSSLSYHSLLSAHGRSGSGLLLDPGTLWPGRFSSASTCREKSTEGGDAGTSDEASSSFLLPSLSSSTDFQFG